MISLQSFQKQIVVFTNLLLLDNEFQWEWVEIDRESEKERTEKVCMRGCEKENIA